MQIYLMQEQDKLVSGFEATKYLLLHDSKHNRHLYELTGDPPIMISASELKSKGFNPKGDFYMAFKIKSFDEVEYPGLNVNEVLLPIGKQLYSPFFATVSQLKIK